MLGLYSMEGHRASGDLIQGFKINEGLAELRGHCGALFQLKGNDTLGGKRENNCARTRDHRVE